MSRLLLWSGTVVLAAAHRRRTIDAKGMVVAPGFIDMLGQSELTILVEPRLPSKIHQSIATEVTGEGGSAAAQNDAIIRQSATTFEHLHMNPDWRTLRQHFARLEKLGIGINLASYVGATQVRAMVLGIDDRQPSAAQLEQMTTLVRDSMHDGAVGVSTSLQYPPGPYAKSGGIYTTHMRIEADVIMQSIDETVRIGREARIQGEIWHLKVAGKAN
jgi:dihydroorotase/N-acyl-D-amino-acid deacylase